MTGNELNISALVAALITASNLESCVATAKRRSVFVSEENFAVYCFIKTVRTEHDGTTGGQIIFEPERLRSVAKGLLGYGPTVPVSVANAAASVAFRIQPQTIYDALELEETAVQEIRSYFDQYTVRHQIIPM